MQHATAVFSFLTVSAGASGKAAHVPQSNIAGRARRCRLHPPLPPLQTPQRWATRQFGPLLYAWLTRFRLS